MAHLRTWEISLVAADLFRRFDAYNSLVFVRDPASRFISSCFEYFRNFQPKTNFRNLGNARRIALITKLIRTELTRVQVISSHRYVHFSPQVWFIMHGDRQIVKHVYPIGGEEDALTSAFDILQIPREPVTVLNRAAADASKALFTKEIMEFVREFYAIDYEFIRAHDHLARGV